MISNRASRILGRRSRAEPAQVGTPAAAAFRNRVATTGFVVLSLGALRVLYPDDLARAYATYLFVLTLGYGHLIGPVVFAGGAMRGWVPAGVPTWLAALFAATTLLTVFTGYVLALGLWPALVFPMLGLATWHAFENDVALEEAYARGKRMGPLPRRTSPHLLGGGLALLFVALFAASVSPSGELALAASAYGAGWDFGLAGLLGRGGAAVAGLVLFLRYGRWLAGTALAAGAVLVPADLTPWMTFADMFGVWTLYHVYSWLLLSGQKLLEARRRDPAEARRRGVQLAAIHALPLALSSLLLLGVLPPDGWLAVLVFSPGAYLFWSVAHTLQTVALRGLETGSAPEPEPARAAARG